MGVLAGEAGRNFGVFRGENRVSGVANPETPVLGVATPENPPLLRADLSTRGGFSARDSTDPNSKVRTIFNYIFC